MPPVNKLKTYGAPRKSAMCRSILLHTTSQIQKPSKRKKKFKIQELPRRHGQTLLADDSLQISTEDTFDKLFRQKQSYNKTNGTFGKSDKITDSSDKQFCQQNSNGINESDNKSLTLDKDDFCKLLRHEQIPKINEINHTREKLDNFTETKNIYISRLGEPSSEKIEESIEIERIRRNKDESLSYIEVPKHNNILNTQQSFILSSTPLTFLRSRKNEVVNSTISPISRRLAYDTSEVNLNKEEDKSLNSFQKLSLIDSLKEYSLNFINLRSRKVFYSSSLSLEKSNKKSGSISVEHNCSKMSNYNSHIRETHESPIKERYISICTNNMSECHDGEVVGKNKTDHNDIIENSLLVCRSMNSLQNKIKNVESMEVSQKSGYSYLQYSKLFESPHGKCLNFVTERRKQIELGNNNDKYDNIYVATQQIHNIPLGESYDDKENLPLKYISTPKRNSILSNTKDSIDSRQYRNNFTLQRWDRSGNNEELSLPAQSINTDSYKRNNYSSEMQCSTFHSDASVIYNDKEYTETDHSMNDASLKIQQDAVSVRYSFLTNISSSVSVQKKMQSIDKVMDMSVDSLGEKSTGPGECEIKHDDTYEGLSVKLANSTASNISHSFSQLTDVSMQEISEKFSPIKGSKQSANRKHCNDTGKHCNHSNNLSVQDITDDRDNFVAAENSLYKENKLSTNNLTCNNSLCQQSCDLEDVKVIEERNDKCNSGLLEDSICSNVGSFDKRSDKRQLRVNLTKCFSLSDQCCSSNNSNDDECRKSVPIFGEYFIDQKHLVVNITNHYYDNHLPDDTTISDDESADSLSDKSRSIGKIWLDRKQLWINLTNEIYPENLPDNISISFQSEHSSHCRNSVSAAEDSINNKQLVVKLSKAQCITPKETNEQSSVYHNSVSVVEDTVNKKQLVVKLCLSKALCLTPKETSKGQFLEGNSTIYSDSICSQFHGFSVEEQAHIFDNRSSPNGTNNLDNDKVDANKNMSSDSDVIESSFLYPMKIDLTSFKIPEPRKTLKAGKLWRRSFSVYKKQNSCQRSAVAGGINCSCTECTKPRKSSYLNNKRVSTRIVPVIVKPEIELEPFKEISVLEEYAITTGYVQSAAAEQERLQHNLENSFKCLSLRRSSIVGSHPVTARDIVLRKCGQAEPISFEKCYPNKLLQNCHKIGEGVYGEVFLLKNPSGGTSVLKIIPIEGDLMVNDERQKKFEEILSEIIIATELHNLRYNPTNKTSGFSEVQKIQCVQGRYPDRLLDLWDLYNETSVSENDCPDIFGDDQLYIVLQLGNAGKDLESYLFNNAIQAFSMFKQVAFALAVAEESLKFEHRDLHWGNVLLNTVEKNKIITFYLDGKPHSFTSFGVEATIIDFTLSRIEDDGVVIFNDLSLDPDLFTAEGDYQFEVYRLMQKKNGNNWKNFEPYTNIVWLHYVIDKAVSALRYKYAATKTHKECLARMKKLAEEILTFKSAKDFVTNYFL